MVKYAHRIKELGEEIQDNYILENPTATPQQITDHKNELENTMISCIKRGLLPKIHADLSNAQRNQSSQRPSWKRKRWRKISTCEGK